MLEIGKIVNTHGLKGDMKVTPWCDGTEVFSALENVIVNGREYKLSKAVPHKGCFLIKLSEVNDINDTAPFINKIIYAKRADLPELPENTYYIKDLIGLSVYNGEELLGEIKDVFSTAANDVYVVGGENGKDILIPAVHEIVKNVSVEGGRVDVVLTKGYFDED